MEFEFELYKQNKNKDYNFITFNKSKITKGKFEQIEQPIWDPAFSINNKPYGGMWATTYTPELKYDSSWQEYLHKDVNGCGGKRISKRAVLFNLTDYAKILKIDSINDLKLISMLFGMKEENYNSLIKYILDNKEVFDKTCTDTEIDRRINTLKYLAKNNNSPVELSYYSLNRYFDGIYLSKKGAHELTSKGYYGIDKLDVSYDPYCVNKHIDPKYNLEHWSVESLLLFNYDCIDIKNQKPIRYNDVEEQLKTYGSIKTWKYI